MEEGIEAKDGPLQQICSQCPFCRPGSWQRLHPGLRRLGPSLDLRQQRAREDQRLADLIGLVDDAQAGGDEDAEEKGVLFMAFIDLPQQPYGRPDQAGYEHRDIATPIPLHAPLRSKSGIATFQHRDPQAPPAQKLPASALRRAAE